jgi:hypothetical protein
MRGARPLQPGQKRLVGEAFTLRFVPAREDLATPESWASPISTRAAIEAMPEGCIAVIDSMGVSDAGVFGDILCARMVKRNVAALITDGVVRDLEGVLGTGLPVWCNGFAAPPSVAGLTFVGWNEPIGCGGVVRVADRLQPGRGAAVERFLHRDVGHRVVRRGAVPVLLAGRDPHRIAGADLLHRFALALHPADAGDDVERLPQRMGVPIGTRAGLEADAQRHQPRRRLGGDDRVLPHRADKILCRRAAGRPRAVRKNLHRLLPDTARSASRCRTSPR